MSSGESRAPNTYVPTFRSPSWLCAETSEGVCEEKHVLCLLCILGWLCCPGRKGKVRPLPYSASLVNNTDDIRDGVSRCEPSYNAAICVVLLNPQNCPPKYHCHFRAMKLRPVGGKRLVRVHAGGKGGTGLRLGVSAPFPTHRSLPHLWLLHSKLCSFTGAWFSTTSTVTYLCLVFLVYGFQNNNKKTAKSCLGGAAAFNLSKDSRQDWGPHNKVLASQEGSWGIFLPGGNGILPENTPGSPGFWGSVKRCLPFFLCLQREVHKSFYSPCLLRVS